MKKIPHFYGAPFCGAICQVTRRFTACGLLALVAFAAVSAIGPAPALRAADESAAVETDCTFPDIENWAGNNWQAAGWPAIQLRKERRIERSIVQLAFDSVSPYNTGSGPSFLLRVRIDGRFFFLTNSNAVIANKSGAILMQKKGRVFEGILPNGGALTDAAVDYGKNTVHYAEGDLNPGNENNPRFTSLRFIPRDANAAGSGEPNGSAAGDGSAGAGVREVSDWVPLSLGIPAYYAGPNWSVAAWPTAQGKIIGKGALIKIGFDGSSVYRGNKQLQQPQNAQNFLCRLVFKNGGTIFLTNSAEVARRKGDVTIMEAKDGCFEAIVSGRGELKEVAIDFGESTLAFGRGTWGLNKTNAADVRFNSLEITPAANADSQSQPATSAPVAASDKPPTASQTQRAEYATPAYYGGQNWLVAVFTGARGLKLSGGKAVSLRLHFDSASCFNADAGMAVSFLLRVVFENGNIIYATNSDKIVAAAPDGKTAKFTINKTVRCFEGSLIGLGEGGAVREIAVDFGESTSHLPVPLNQRNENNPRFTKLTVLGES